MTLYNDKGINQTRGYNTCKYLCTQPRKYIKQILMGIKGGNDSKPPEESRYILKDWNHTKYLFQPQSYEIINQW